LRQQKTCQKRREGIQWQYHKAKSLILRRQEIQAR
jgi:hypothetical protein